MRASRAFVPEFRHVREFLEVFLRVEGGDIQPVPGEADGFRLRLPDALRRELGVDAVERGTFGREIQVSYLANAEAPSFTPLDFADASIG